MGLTSARPAGSRAPAAVARASSASASHMWDPSLHFTVGIVALPRPCPPGPMPACPPSGCGGGVCQTVSPRTHAHMHVCLCHGVSLLQPLLTYTHTHTHTHAPTLLQVLLSCCFATALYCHLSYFFHSMEVRRVGVGSMGAGTVNISPKTKRS